MSILIALMIISTSCVVMKLLRTQRARIPRPAHPQRVRAEPPNGSEPDTGDRDAPVWNALDDRQLTRLLTSSAPPTTSEQDPA